MSVTCVHCDRVIVSTDAHRLVARHYQQLRHHFKAGCAKLSTDLTYASVGEVLKHCRVMREANN